MIERVLVIKLSALGDFVLSIGAFQAIRRHHPEARITLLTTGPFTGLAEASGCFDQVWCDSRPGLGQVGAWLALARRLRSGRFQRVYDLQRSDRSGWYFRLLARPKPEWVGTVSGCSHRYRQPAGPPQHIAARQAAQLAMAGIEAVPAPDLSFLTADLGKFNLPKAYALLVPGGAPHRPAKRWPAARFAELAQVIAERGLAPILLGTAPEAKALTDIATACATAHNLCGGTDLAEIATLARQAAFAVGNDTGPMHLISAAGCPVVSLFSADSDPAKVAPIGPSVAVLRRDDLSELPLEAVLEVLPKIPPSPTLDKPGEKETSTP
ncbi:MAG: glycosyltransferase family 9 protein [Pseudomonadota bacterium]